MPGYLDSVSGITFGWADGEDDWGSPTNRSLKQIAYAGVHLSVIEMNANTPPTTAGIGDKYVIGTSPTGAWASFSNGDVVVYGRQDANPVNLGWLSYVPKQGWLTYNAESEQLFVYDGAAWNAVVGSGGSALATIRHDNTLTGTGISDNLSVNFDRQIQSDWNVTSTSSAAHIRNIPDALRNFSPTSVPRPFWQKFSKLSTYSLSSGSLSESDRLAQVRLDSQVADTYDLRLGAGVVIDVSSAASTTQIRLSVTRPGTTSNITSSASVPLSDRRVFVSSSGNNEFDVYATVTATGTDNVNVSYTVHGGLAVG